MVFFTCNACGASLKKNQVEKHYLHQCRQCEVLTCIDCLKDFPGDSYIEHTKCISEEERYSAKGWQPKANANKGAKKQAAWLERLQQLIEDRSHSLDNDIKQVLLIIQGYENIPRKKQKFINFCKNVLSRKFSPSVIDKTWEVFEEALKDPTKSPGTLTAVVENAKSSEPNSNISKKRKHEDKENGTTAEEVNAKNDGIPMFPGTKKAKIVDKDSVEEEPTAKPKFDWTDCVTQIVDKKGSIKWSKLKKKVVNEYITRYPDTVKTRMELESKLEKKVKKNKKFKCSNEIISIATSRL